MQPGQSAQYLLSAFCDYGRDPGVWDGGVCGGHMERGYGSHLRLPLESVQCSASVFVSWGSQVGEDLGLSGQSPVI